jgi:predicted Zn-dependent protease
VSAALSADDWFRSSDWDDPARELFEEKLSRARPWNAPQYLRIQGLTLLESGNVEPGRQLLLRLITEYPHETSEVWVAHESLGDSYRRDSRARDAERHYRAAMSLGEPGSTTQLLLAELLLDTEQVDRYAEARDLLADEQLVAEAENLRSEAFRHAVALARVEARLGNASDASKWAIRALELRDEDVQGPQFARHRDVARVESPPALVAELARLAAHKPS